MLTLPRSYVDNMIAHSRKNDPIESCGIIAGKNGKAVKLYRAFNVDASPYTYNVHSKNLLRIYRDMENNGWDVMVIYHSHSHTQAYPSETDRRLAAWPDAYYVIVSLEDKLEPVVRAFRITDGEVSEEELQVV